MRVAPGDTAKITVDLDIAVLRFLPEMTPGLYRSVIAINLNGVVQEIPAGGLVMPR
jgi:hypothetical protein